MRLLPTLALLTTTLALAQDPQQAPQRRPMTFADLQAMKRVSDPQISPSGKWVLFTVTDVSLENNTKISHLWVVPVDGSSPAVQVSNRAGEWNGRFSPGTPVITYTSLDTGFPEVWYTDWDEAHGKLDGALVRLTYTGGADGAIWFPDSIHYLFVSDVYPECESHAPMGDQRNQEEARCNDLKDKAADKSPVKARIFDHLLYRHWNEYTGPKHSHIFMGAINERHEPATDLTPASVVGDHEAPTAFPTGGPLGYAISPDGTEIAYVVNLDKVPAESTNNDIFILQLGAAPSTAKKVSTSPGSDDGPQYSPDGKYLAWRSQARAGFESDKFRLTEMERATGKITDVLPIYDGWIDEFAYSRAEDGTDRWGSFYITSGYRGQEPILVGPNPKALPPFPTKTGDVVHEGYTADGQAMTLWGPGEYSSLNLSQDGKWLAAVRMHVNEPSDIVVFISDRCNRQEIKCSHERADRTFMGGQITHLNNELLSQLNLPKMESFTFAGANGTEVQGFLIRPPNFDPSKKYPLKFLIHGGPQGAWGDAWSYRWNPELFAANGYVVVMINPRGSTGYGQQFVDEVSGDWGGRPYIDLMKGLDYAEKTYPFIDKKRECALGASYGGFMADYILTHTDRFACIVTHDGMYNPQSAFGTTEELWFNEWEFRPLVGNGPHAVVEQTKLAHPWDFYNLPAAQDPFRKFSPMLAIQNAKTPTLVIHGQKDYRLDVSEGLQLFTALQLRGIPSKMLYFPDEGHWVQKPQNSQLWYDTVNDWCDRWTHTNAYASTAPR